MPEYHVDPYTDVVEEQEQFVTGVFAHPLHGRLIERVILWVRPEITFKGGTRYKLTWWAGGVAYYERVSD